MFYDYSNPLCKMQSCKLLPHASVATYEAFPTFIRMNSGLALSS